MLGKAAKTLEIPFAALSLPDARNWLKGARPEEHIITFEQEHVDEDLLRELKFKGISSFPTWESFDQLKSKRNQKEFLNRESLPTAAFVACSPWTEACDVFLRENQGAVLKAGRGGYDGKGVWIINANGLTSAGERVQDVAARIQQPYLEKRVPFDEEIAAVVCRSNFGEILTYPTVKSIQLDGICFQVEYSRVTASSTLALRAGEIAAQIARSIGYVGVLAVEFFVCKGEILVNEIAPRVHNSGHFTIDVCAGSQFENHLRAGLGLPLAHAEPTHPAAVMVNLLWPPSEREFAPLFAKLTCGSPWPDNVKLHWYGKSEIRPRRKMGHFTVYGESLQECRDTARQVLASRWVQG
jgi:5-(carboxyamino)imidazole ribonucleotide synthase